MTEYSIRIIIINRDLMVLITAVAAKKYSHGDIGNKYLIPSFLADKDITNMNRKVNNIRDNCSLFRYLRRFLINGIATIASSTDSGNRTTRTYR